MNKDTLNERIRQLELAISRCGDATIKRATRQRLDRLYKQRDKKTTD